MSDDGVRYRRVVELDDAAAVDLAALVLHGLRAIRASGHGVSWNATRAAETFVAIGRDISQRDSVGGSAEAEDGTLPELPSVTVATMTSTEVAHHANVSDSYVRRACREGSLRSYAHLSARGYRIEIDAALRWIESHRKQSTP